MRKISNTTPSFFLLFFSIGFLLFSACAKIDEFTGFTNNENSSLKLRKYSGVPLNIPPLVEYILDKNDYESLNLHGNIRKVCDYTKIPFQTTFLEDWNQNPKINGNVRVLCFLNSKKLNSKSIEIITEFVAKGGTLYMPFGSEDPRFSFLIGLKPIPENNFQTDTHSSGIFFNTPIIPGLKDHIYNQELKFFGLKEHLFTDKIKILATAATNPKYPFIIENSIGKGRVIYYNSNFYISKAERGLIMSALLKGLEGIPYPVVNVGTIFLDDFPAPLYDVKKEPIASELNLTIADYVYKVWWSDLVKLGKKHNISYTAMTTFDYNVNVTPPFLFREWDSRKIKIDDTEEGLCNWLVKDVLKNNHELAFHGYNHVSLLSPNWKNPDFMITSIKAAEKKWKVSDYGAMPVTYVPPSNDIDRVGLRQLKKAMPSLQFMCSIILGEKKIGGNREFDFDPYEPDLFDFPRVSSGFYLDRDNTFAVYSMYLYTGIWTHFIHPDDIYQIKDKSNISQGNYGLRNVDNLGWYKTPHSKKAMLPEFDKLITTLKTDFPFMRFKNAREGGVITNDWRASYFNHKTENGCYTVEKLKPEESDFDSQDWFVYVEYENTSAIENELRKVRAMYKKMPCMNGYLYSIRTNGTKLTLPDFNYKSELELKQLPLVVQNVKNDYNNFIAKTENVGKEDNSDDYDEKLALEIKALKQRMLNEPKINPLVWDKYAEYTAWNEKLNPSDDVWKLLEEHCIKYPLPENILYSKKLSLIVYYPNDLIQEKWMHAQMLVTPNDASLLNSYIATFYTPENQEKIKVALINLLKVDTSAESYKKYIDYLLNYEPENAITELDKIKPSIEFKDLAATFAWAYADAENYQKAWDWSAYTNEIDFYSKMQWLIALKDYKKLIEEYNLYIKNNPDDFRVKAQMSTAYHEMGKFKEAWILAQTLPDVASDKESLQKMLNNDVVYEEPEVINDLLQNYAQFFYPNVFQKLSKDARQQTGNFVNFSSALESNRKDPSAFKNVLSYTIFDTKLNQHGIGVTYSNMYDLKVDLQDPDNVTHNLVGLQYQFNNPRNYDKLQYWSRIRYEYSDFKKSFFQFGAGANYSKNKSYSSAEVKIAPFENGPSHSKSIYRFQLNLYQEYFFFKYWNTILSLEGNYFNKSEKLGKEYFVNESYEGSATGKIIFDRWMDNKYRFLPFVEASRSQASLGKSTISLATGYPYWMIDDRFFIGGGLGFAIGKPENDFNARVEGAWFNDDYASEFTRLTGNLNYQLFDYTMLTTSFEFYFQSKFYSNAFQFGVKHNLKRKQKK